MACLVFDDDWILHGMVIIKNEDILFVIALGCLLAVLVELLEYLRDIFHLFVDVDDLVGEYGVLVLESCVGYVCDVSRAPFDCLVFGAWLLALS